MSWTNEQIAAATEGQTVATLFRDVRHRPRRPGRAALAGRRRLAGVDLRGIRRRPPPGSPPACRARDRPGRPGRADDAQPARVPRRRRRLLAPRRHADLDLQLLVARPDRVPRRPLRGVGRAIVEDDGFLDRFLAVRDELPTLRELVVDRAAGDGRRTASTRGPTLLAGARSTSRRAPTIAQPTTSRPSSTRRARPVRRRA